MEADLASVLGEFFHKKSKKKRKGKTAKVAKVESVEETAMEPHDVEDGHEFDDSDVENVLPHLALSPQTKVNSIEPADDKEFHIKFPDLPAAGPKLHPKPRPEVVPRGKVVDGETEESGGRVDMSMPGTFAMGLSRRPGVGSVGGVSGSSSESAAAKKSKPRYVDGKMGFAFDPSKF